LVIRASSFVVLGLILMALTIFLADLTNGDHQQAIVELLDMYCRDQFGDLKPLSDPARENLIPGLRKHGGARVFLAYEDEKPLGIAICMIGFSSFRGKPLINIHDIAVCPEGRGQGVGRQLLNAVTDEAKKLGCGKVTLEVRSDNARAMGLYQSVGFKPSEPETYFWTQVVD
jgi:ribosomal protein S18 acetylase RimI-like enzyme